MVFFQEGTAQFLKCILNIVFYLITKLAKTLMILLVAGMQIQMAHFFKLKRITHLNKGKCVMQ